MPIPFATDDIGLVGVAFAGPPLLLLVGLIVLVLRERRSNRDG